MPAVKNVQMPSGEQMRIIVCTIFCVWLAGCGTSLQGTGVPKPDEVAGFADETVGQAMFVRGAQGPHAMTAGEYLAASISYTNEKCYEFFDNLEKVRQDSSFVDKVLQAAAAVAAAEKATELVTGLIAANTINGAAAEVYAFSLVRDQLKRHVFQDRDDYLAERNLNLGIITGDAAGPKELRAALASYEAYTNGRERLGQSSKSEAEMQLVMRLRFIYSTKPLDLMLARNIAAGYASICSLAHMREIVISSLDRTSEAKDIDAKERAANGNTSNRGREFSTNLGAETAPLPAISQTAPAVPSLR
jgi:hypothetical protein